jgi:TetR/AcrR family transcriptional regulator
MAEDEERTIVRQSRSEAVRTRLLAAALEQFSTVGFEAASTREIAAAARTHQPQINYHFGSKSSLWQAVMDQLFSELDASLADILDDIFDSEPHVVLADFCRRFVRFAAHRPELNRIMVHESTADTERLAWLVERHIRHRFQVLKSLCERLDPTSVPTTDPVIFHYCLVGASSLMAVNAKEGTLLIGHDPLAGRVEAHAEAVALMLLGPNPRSRKQASRPKQSRIPKRAERS